MRPSARSAPASLGHQASSASAAPVFERPRRFSDRNDCNGGAATDSDVRETGGPQRLALRIHWGGTKLFREALHGLLHLVADLSADDLL